MLRARPIRTNEQTIQHLIPQDLNDSSDTRSDSGSEDWIPARTQNNERRSREQVRADGTSEGQPDITLRSETACTNEAPVEPNKKQSTNESETGDTGNSTNDNNDSNIDNNDTSNAETC